MAYSWLWYFKIAGERHKDAEVRDLNEEIVCAQKKEKNRKCTILVVKYADYMSFPRWSMS